jgi:hypothetical protein
MSVVTEIVLATTGVLILLGAFLSRRHDLSSTDDPSV